MPNFAQDLSDGHSFEDDILSFIQRDHPLAIRIKGHFKGYDIDVPCLNHQIECKYDRKSKETGNIAIEFACNGKPSGITSTTATHWIYKLWDGEEWKLAIGRVEVWRRLCKGQRVVKGGDGWRAEMYLIPGWVILEEGGIKIRKP